MIIHLKEEESAFKERELNMDNEILIKATELTDAAELEMKKEYEIKVASIKDEYEKKKSAIYDVTIAAIIYGFVVTMLKLLSSVRMRGDISRCFRNMYLFITGMWDINMVMIENIWKMTSHQDKRIAWFALAVFLTIIVIGLQVATAGTVIAGIYVFLRWAYNDYKFDFPMAIVMLVTMIMIVWFADKLRFISWNLIIVWIMVQLGVIMARAVAESNIL